MTLKKGATSIDEYLIDFNLICDNLLAIGKPIKDLDKCFHFSRGLGLRYQSFRLAMFAKESYPTITQFTLALKDHEQAIGSFETDCE